MFRILIEICDVGLRGLLDIERTSEDSHWITAIAYP